MATIDDRDQYITEAVAFAKSLAERLGKPAAERLFCPSFKNRPCGCLQTYISHQGWLTASEIIKVIPVGPSFNNFVVALR